MITREEYDDRIKAFYLAQKQKYAKSNDTSLIEFLDAYYLQEKSRKNAHIKITNKRLYLLKRMEEYIRSILSIIIF
ncbi:MAG: hypothetical protein LBS39_02595 [Campylobacteraceae bacterium]|nr:hypothetical protein [Campylobacteraceae bacterium]